MHTDNRPPNWGIKTGKCYQLMKLLRRPDLMAAAGEGMGSRLRRPLHNSVIPAKSLPRTRYGAGIKQLC